jgi:hypothetical protein
MAYDTEPVSPARSRGESLARLGVVAVLLMAALEVTELLVTMAVRDDRPDTIALAVAIPLVLVAWFVPRSNPAGRVIATIFLAFGVLVAFDAFGEKQLGVRLVELAEIVVGLVALAAIWIAALRR